MDWKTLLFTFDGRINRAKFWLAVLILVLLYIAAAIVTWLLGTILGQTIGGILSVIVGLAVLVAGIWAGLATAIKRLHDREKSGWWVLLFWLVPVVLSGIGAAFSIYFSDSALSALGFLFSAASLAVSVWYIVEVGCLKGTTGPNMYGSDPLPAEPD